MDTISSFGKCTLSKRSLHKIKLINGKLKGEAAQSNSAWKVITSKRIKIVAPPSDIQQKDGSSQTSSHHANIGERSIRPKLKAPEDLQSTQFFYTQQSDEPEKPKTKAKERLPSRLENEKSIAEGLSFLTKDKFETDMLEKLSSNEICGVMKELNKIIDVAGCYNLCKFISEMNAKERVKYVEAVFSQVLVPKILSLKMKSNQLEIAVETWVGVSLEDVRKFVFVPLLNAELNEFSIDVVKNIVEKCSPANRLLLMGDFALSVVELRDWHIPILLSFLKSARVEPTVKISLLKLFNDKSLAFSQNNEFGKLIGMFIMKCKPFDDEEKRYLIQINDVHTSSYKQRIEGFIKNL